MAVLHGSWLPQRYLFLWGATWQRVSPILQTELSHPLPYPFALSLEELQTWITTLFPHHQLPCQQSTTQTIALPTWFTVTTIVPCYGASDSAPLDGVSIEDLDSPEAPTLQLYPWQVEGICLPPGIALPWLSSLPLGASSPQASPQVSPQTSVGGDVRLWAHIARWSLDLLARGKFLPRLEQTSEGMEAYWQPLLDSSTDQQRLESFARTMPGVCCCYQTDQPISSEPPPPSSVGQLLAVALPIPPRQLITDFLRHTIDQYVRSVASRHIVPSAQLNRREATGIDLWMGALAKPQGKLPASSTLDRLSHSLRAWLAPLQSHLMGKPTYRPYLKLHPPSHEGNDWWLAYALQSASHPDVVVPAAVIWSNPVEQLVYQGQTIAHPQETLLAGLGLASRLYAPLEASLNTSNPQGCALSPIQAYEFLKVAAWRLQDSGVEVVIPPALARLDGLANRLGVRVIAGAETLPKGQRIGLNSLLNLELELTIGNQTLTPEDLNRLTSMGTPLVEINGEWVELRPSDVRAAQDLFVANKSKTTLSLQDVLRLSAGDTQMIEKLPVVSFEAGPLQELISTLTGKNQTIEPVQPPASFHGTLRPYQARGVGWLAFLERWGLGACLADDMGLGKTVQAIALLLHLKESGNLEQPCLLVCPTSVLGNWEREVRKFAPTLKLLVHHGAERAKGKAFAKALKGKHLVITTYALLHRDATELQGIQWHIVMLDEAQNIKNAESKQSQAARQIPAQFRIALTGTPIENRLTELWSILDFLNPGYLGARNFFQRRFAIPIEKYGDTASLQTLRSLVQPFILRRLKTDKDIIQDLPDKQEMTVFCGLSAEQANLYQEVVQTTLVQIESAEGIQRHGLILSLLTKLKQICNHPAHYRKEPRLTSAQPSGKLQRLEEMLEEAVLEGDRALIFTQFAEWGKLLQAYLAEKLHQEVLFLYGSTPRAQREAIVDRFQHDPQAPSVLILSLKAGGTGLNLTRANHVFHIDRWWNPAVENQATDRAFRIGQTRNVQVHKFVCTGTLEEKIHDLIESKKALAEQVVSAGENWLTELDTNQLRELLLLDRNAIIDGDQ